MKRTLTNTKLKYINEVGHAILKENGGLLLEKDLVNKILSTIDKSENVDAYIVRLALTISHDLSNLEKTNMFTSAWHLSTIGQEQIVEVLNHAISILKDTKDVIEKGEFHKTLLDKKFNIEDISESFFESVLKIDQRLKIVDEGYGLMTWRHINPKSIRDKAYIVLKKTKKATALC